MRKHSSTDSSENILKASVIQVVSEPGRPIALRVVDMVHTPWTRDEFGIILQNYNLGPRDFARLLPNKNPGAIESVQSGIHSFHLGGSGFLLTEMMLTALMEARGSLVCPICGTGF